MDYTLIIKGNKLESFKPFRGIRQGDPLSPYLFITTMDYLSVMISNTVAFGVWKPFKIKNHDLNISHLPFADDILLFAKADNNTLSSVKNTINHFCNNSGMEINLDKSKIGYPLIPPLTGNRLLQISCKLILP